MSVYYLYNTSSTCSVLIWKRLFIFITFIFSRFHSTKLSTRYHLQSNIRELPQTDGTEHHLKKLKEGNRTDFCISREPVKMIFLDGGFEEVIRGSQNKLH